MLPIKYINNHGTEYWQLSNGDLHREDGPAIIFADGELAWYLNNICFGFDGYCHVLKIDHGKTDEDIMMIRMQYDINQNH